MKANKSLDVALKVAEQQHDRELNSKIAAKMRESAKEEGHADGLRRAILSRLTSQEYARAIDDLHDYVNTKHEYPQFKIRTERYVHYAIDLINAIKAKRSFPGLQHLNMSKQQELYDKAMLHFEDLKATLKKVEEIERQVRLEDVRSTVWVIKAIIFSVFGICIIGFLMELSKGVLPTAMAVADDVLGRTADWFFLKTGF
jgi:hypothetical protein